MLSISFSIVNLMKHVEYSTFMPTSVMTEAKFWSLKHWRLWSPAETTQDSVWGWREPLPMWGSLPCTRALRIPSEPSGSAAWVWQTLRTTAPRILGLVTRQLCRWTNNKQQTFAIIFANSVQAEWRGSWCCGVLHPSELAGHDAWWSGQFHEQVQLLQRDRRHLVHGWARGIPEPHQTWAARHEHVSQLHNASQSNFVGCRYEAWFPNWANIRKSWPR